MTLEVYIHSNNGSVIEIPDGTENVSINNNQQLSLEEFDEIVARLAELSMKIDGPDAKPLSDYAMSRESIYEDHP
ncbi:MAG: hypothetical protein OXM61_02235 [Candidatus Poribacteria bacterium]|nr:hypothetical protein [Candidatus Poribacteria bacterium]